MFNSSPVPDIEPIDLSTRSYIITKCVEKVFFVTSSEDVKCNKSDMMSALEYLC